MTLEKIHTEMKRYNQAAAPGSECNAWQEFVADCDDRLGCMPWNDQHWDDEVPADFAEFWHEVASGQSSTYDAETGVRIDDLGY